MRHSRRAQKGQHGRADKGELGDGEPEALAERVCVDHVVARVDEPTDVRTIRHVWKVDDPVVLVERLDVREDEPDIAALVER